MQTWRNVRSEPRAPFPALSGLATPQDTSRYVFLDSSTGPQCEEEPCLQRQVLRAPFPTAWGAMLWQLKFQGDYSCQWRRLKEPTSVNTKRRWESGLKSKGQLRRRRWGSLFMLLRHHPYFCSEGEACTVNRLVLQLLPGKSTVRNEAGWSILVELVSRSRELCVSTLYHSFICVHRQHSVHMEVREQPLKVDSPSSTWGPGSIFICWAILPNHGLNISFLLCHHTHGRSWLSKPRAAVSIVPPQAAVRWPLWWLVYI